MHLQVHRGAPRQWGGDKPPPARAVHLGAPGHGGGRSPLRHATEAGHHRQVGRRPAHLVGGGQGRSPAREGMQSLCAPAASRLPRVVWGALAAVVRPVDAPERSHSPPRG